jgi:DNA replication and repair protein RecF
VLVRRLRLVNVRSHRRLEVELGPGLTVLAGPNGAGKTTVLEAAALVLQGSLLRPGTVRDLINRGEDFLRVEIDLEEAGVMVTAAAAFSRGGERRLTASGAVLDDSSRWREAVPVRTFVPDDLRLIKGSPRRRREYLDALAGRRDTAYPGTLRSYEEALTQRNVLLRGSRAGDCGHFAPWEKILAQTGLAVSWERAATLASFVASFQRTYADLTGESLDSLRLVYRTNVADLDEKGYQDRLAQMRGADRQRTYTHLGPHRDDLRLLRRGLDVRDCASQGEQRAAVLALVLAEWRHMRGSPHEPLLLLDDVISELDGHRRRALVDIVHQGGQAVITTTDLRHFSSEELERVAVIELSTD